MNFEKENFKCIGKLKNKTSTTVDQKWNNTQV